MVELLEHALRLAPELAVLVYLVIRTNTNLVMITREQNDAMQHVADKLSDVASEVRATKELVHAGLAFRSHDNLREPVPEADPGANNSPGGEIQEG